MKRSKCEGVCTLPWQRLELYQDGLYGPCCYVKFAGKGSPRSPADVERLFNGEEMRALRRRLTEGRLGGTVCEHCYQYSSLRSFDFPDFSAKGPLFEREVLEPVRAAHREGRDVVTVLPLSYGVYTSEACNLDCIMCSQSKEDRPQDFRTLLAIWQAQGWDRIGKIVLIGGEVLFTSDGLGFLDGLANAPLEGTVVGMFTNGLLLKRHLPLLQRIERLELTISIDGVDAAYERVRHRAKWSKLMANLEALYEVMASRPDWRLSFNTVVMRSTVASVRALLDLAQAFRATPGFVAMDGFLPGESLTQLAPQERRRIAAGLAIEREYARNIGAHGAAADLASLMVLIEQGVVRGVRFEAEVAQRLERLGRRLQGSPVVIYGAGEHTTALLDHLHAQGISLSVEAVVDRDRRKWGSRLYDCPVVSPEYLDRYQGAVLISSRRYEADMVSDAETRGELRRVWTLYQ